MGLWNKLKETFSSEKQDLQEKWSEEDKGSRMAEKVGQKIGEGIRHVGGKIHEKYKEKYGGGEYREARIKDIQSKAREMEAKSRLVKAQVRTQNVKQQKKGLFNIGMQGKQDFSSIIGKPGPKKKDPYAHLFGEKRI